MNRKRQLTRITLISLLNGVLAICSAAAAFGQTNPVPFINQPLAPTAVAPGGPAFTLTVSGTGFVRGSTVNWNGQTLATHFVSQSKVTATVPASNIAVAGTASLTVSNPAPAGGTSNVAYFLVSTVASSFGLSGPTLQTSAGCAAATGDFDGDGKLDLMVSDCHTIFVLLGNGDGTFKPAVAYGTGGPSPMYAAVADINGDGKEDIIAAGSGENNNGIVAVLLGNGDGTFQAAKDSTYTFAGSQAVGLAVGDLNGDGKLDVAVGDDFAPGLFVLLGNGDGTFTESYSTPTPVGWLVTGDFNRDGKLDLAAADFSASTGILIFLGNGDGTFQPGVHYSTPDAQQLIAADFNGDGKLDLVGVSGPHNDMVGILLGNGDGTFQPVQEFATGNNPEYVSAGDFNADGKLDLAVANSCGNDPTTCFSSTSATVSILLGKGDGTFQTHAEFPSGVNFVLAAGDFNGDGKLDVASGSSSLSILLQTTAVLSPGATLFPAQIVGTSSTAQTVTLTNAGSATLSISGISLAGLDPGDFSQTNTCGGTLAPGANCAISVTFTPTAQGTRCALLSVSDNALGSPQQALLTGTGVAPVATLSSSSITFPIQIVGSTSSGQQVGLTNTGNATLTIGSITVSGNFRELNNCGTTLAPGAMCTITIAFHPTGRGVHTGAVTVSDNALGSPQTISLTGTGEFFTLSRQILNFGNQPVGTTSNPMTVTLTNTGAKSMALEGVRFSGADVGDFSQTNNCVSPIPAGGTCTFSVTFTPLKKGNRGTNLQVSGGGATQVVNLIGNGT